MRRHLEALREWAIHRLGGVTEGEVARRFLEEAEEKIVAVMEEARAEGDRQGKNRAKARGHARAIRQLLAAGAIEPHYAGALRAHLEEERGGFRALVIAGVRINPFEDP